MNFSLNLLKKFVSIEVPAAELAELLTERVFEVEDVRELAAQFNHVIAAKVTKVEKHPNADRLRIVTVTDGKKELGPIVCGAHNFDVGATVALALPGAHIPQNIHSDSHEGFTLEKATIRGVESQGMICARFELGLSDKPEDGIWLLDEKVALGTEVAELIPQDTILDIALPPNRPDLYSHFGVAREIHAVLGYQLKDQPRLGKIRPSKESTFHVQVEDYELTPKFWAAKINIKVQPSPQWLQDHLHALGSKSINNVVDITNYVMSELGQPLHAFDATAISGTMHIRKAEAGENITLLNRKGYKLEPTMLVIADDKKALDVAGIMGGADSEVKPETKTIILTAANFNPTNIRQTSKKLGLRSDASALFEKGLHPNLTDLAMARAMELLREHAAARIAEIALIDHSDQKLEKINLTPDEINNLLGTRLTPTEIHSYLSRFGIKITGTKTMVAVAPWWRPDLRDAPDLAEEVLKVHGVNTVVPQPFTLVGQSPSGFEALWRNLRVTKEFWTRSGYFEVQNYSFVSGQDITKYERTPADHIAITNPQSVDQGYLKRDLFIPLLKNVRANQYFTDDFRLYEIGKHYNGFENEPLILSGVSFSKTVPVQKRVAELKGDIVQFVQVLGITNLAFEVGSGSVTLMIGETNVGSLGLFSAEVRQNFDITNEVTWFELDLTAIYQFRKDLGASVPNKFPKIKRDISLVVGSGTRWQSIERVIRSGSDLIQDVSIIEADFLTTDKAAKEFHDNLQKQNQKNLGIRVVFQAPDRTLTEAEITGIFDQILVQLGKELGAHIR
jgi:phenylalanyl-tRNA synthetase beta chain